MTDPREHLLDWLRDAHAMEQQAEQMLKAQASRIENYPEQQAGDAETERVCEQILAQEQAMAQWVHDNLPEVTRTFMLRDATEGVEAKK